MKYNTRLTFHIPLYAGVDNKVSETIHSDFESVLINRINAKCTCKMQLSVVKVQRFGKMIDEKLLIVHCDSEYTPELTNIFLHLVCDYHSDLVQDEYLYEINDVLISVRGVGCHVK